MEGIRFNDEEIKKVVKSLDFEKLQGIIPSIALNENGKVLMLAFMNKEALERTLATGMMHYWSRSRKKLWMKGEESKHYQYVLGAYTDCDSDSILFKVHQVGPACHTGQETCFYNAIREFKGGMDILEELEAIIQDRMKSPKAESYTTKIIRAGIKQAAKKVGEEGVETGIASLVEDKERTASEAADLIYHLLILLKMKGIGIRDVLEELERRRK